MPITQLTKKLELGKKINSLISSFNKTNLDIESPEPTGGPINDKPSNYKHKYTGKPGEKYLDHFQPSASPNSGFGIKGENINPQKNILVPRIILLLISFFHSLYGFLPSVMVSSSS